MKRSDMIAAIHTELQLSFEYDNLKELSVGILDLIENLGMLPPERNHYIDQINGNTLCSSDCSWEPEDV